MPKQQDSKRESTRIRERRLNGKCVSYAEAPVIAKRQHNEVDNKSIKDQNEEHIEPESSESKEPVTTKKGDKKQFDFFHLRTCFRTVTGFYKDTFQKQNFTYDKKVGIASITKKTMDLEITKFINQRFGPKVLDDNTLSEEQRC